MKYKLLKWYPSLPKDWEVDMELGIGDSSVFYSPCNCKYTLHYISKNILNSNSEFFAPYLFTTEDGVEIYRGDWYVPIVNNNLWERQKAFGDTSQSYSIKDTKYFSTKEAAQKYLDDLKPKFEKGDWIYVTWKSFFNLKTLLKFDSYDTPDDNMMAVSEWYTVYSDGSVDAKGYNNRWGIASKTCTYQKATPEQIEEVLSKVAEHKGFKEGVKFKSAYSGIQCVAKEKSFRYNSETDGLYNVSAIYHQGKWAEIVKDEIPEYVQLVGGWSVDDEFIGEIFELADLSNLKKFKCAPSENEFRRSITDWIKIGCFKPSTKSEYDLQQFKNNSKQVTVTVDGQITSVSSYGSEVKINYITK